MNKKILLAIGMLVFTLSGRGRGEAATWTRIGPPGQFFSISIDPFDSSRVLAATSGGLYESEDGGAHWALRTISPPATLVAFDAAVPGVAYAGTSFYVSLSNGVKISGDGGVTWSSTALIGPDRVDSLAVSAFPSDRVYAATEYIGGLNTLRFTDFWSDDRGQSWNAFRSQADFLSPIVPERSGPVVYAFDAKGQIVRSADAAETFDATAPLPTTCIGDQPTGIAFVALAIDPRSSDVVYATRVNQKVDCTVCGGASKSVDGGRTWTEMSVGGFVTTLAVDPADADVIYAGAALQSAEGCHPGGATLHRSTDGGLTWSPFDDGLESRDILTFAIDPNGHHVYAGTVDGLYVFETPGRTRVLTSPRPDRGAPMVRRPQP